MNKGRKKAETKGKADAVSVTTNEDQEIAYCQIHPGLGIARIGNSPDEYFIGPESPGHASDPQGGFKDRLGRIKRQAARFRIYAYNKQGRAIKELTAQDAHITWTVELANQKAAYDMFLGEYWAMQYPCFAKQKGTHPGFDCGHPKRNQEVKEEAERERLLVIKPGPRSISGANEKGQSYVFDKGGIGPLPYTVVTNQNRDCLYGSRSGYMNKLMCPPYQPSEMHSGCDWKEGQLLDPVATSDRVEVPLGELRTDVKGRLLVLGGTGKSGSVIPNNPVGFLNQDSFYANNDYWYDDTSDGPVSAEVVLPDGRRVEVKDKAWVIVAPPKYAPHQQVLTTLYDIAFDAVTPNAPSTGTSFTRDIYPVLERINGYQWVNSQAGRQHGAGKVYDVFAEPLFSLLHTTGGKNPDAVQARNHLFSRLRTPHQLLPEQNKYKTFEELVNSPAAEAQANASYMPQMAGDGGEPVTFGTDQAKPENTPGGPYVTWLTLTPNQYQHFKRWATGDFTDDWPADTAPGALPLPPPLPTLPVAEQPAALDRAALDFCVGGAFYPGIEITYISREAKTWSGLCRINQSWKPGDITRHMALPWQADFSECKDHWWPAQRPDDVVPEAEYENFLASYDESLDGPLAQVLQFSQPWARGISTQSPALDNDMVEAWKDFGFVVPKTGPGLQTVYVETERSPYVGYDARAFFYYLMNIDSYPDFLPKARLLVEEFLAQARHTMTQPPEQGDAERYSFFRYTSETLTARLNQIYNDYVTQNSSDATYVSDIMQTREQVINRLIQTAPFNQLDGAWLRNATPSGPIGDVESLIFSIYMDEMGDGNVEQQHCNVYTDTLKNVNVYLPEIHTREYTNDPRFLDSAFDAPVFLLAISQFSAEYFPEILGMTLYLEWSSIGLIPIVDKLRSFGIDPQYYVLHVGIDNAASGHGARAKTAVQMYLDQIRQGEGDATMQEIWKRIWTGYVAFATAGTLGQDMLAEINDVNDSEQTPPDRKTVLTNQMMDMITRKAPYASLNHRQKTLGGTYINDWFLDPAGFLNAMQEAGIIIPGQPDISPIFQLTSFKGPMYHVFTDDELDLWRNYILSLTEPDPGPPLGTIDAMCELINYLRERQQRNAGHTVLLTGPNPYPDGKQPYVTNTIHWWFNLNLEMDRREADLALMRTLCFAGTDKVKGNGWIVKGDAMASPLVTTMLSGNNDMAQAFRYVAPHTGGKTYREVMVRWINEGCPTEETVIKAAQLKPARKHYRVLGMGTVH